MTQTQPTNESKTMKKDYSDYLKYMSRNKPEAVPVSYESFCDMHSENDGNGNENDVNDKSHPIHY